MVINLKFICFIVQNKNFPLKALCKPYNFKPRKMIKYTQVPYHTNGIITYC